MLHAHRSTWPRLSTRASRLQCELVRASGTAANVHLRSALVLLLLLSLSSLSLVFILLVLTVLLLLSLRLVVCLINISISIIGTAWLFLACLQIETLGLRSRGSDISKPQMRPSVGPPPSLLLLVVLLLSCIIIIIVIYVYIYIYTCIYIYIYIYRIYLREIVVSCATTPWRVRGLPCTPTFNVTPNTRPFHSRVWIHNNHALYTNLNNTRITNNNTIEHVIT